MRKAISIIILAAFISTSVKSPAYAQVSSVDPAGLSFRLPKPGIRVNLSPVFEPALIKGLKIHPENPFRFDFIVDPGDEKLSTEDFYRTSQRMVNYFLAALTTPEKDLWVNLSPVEKDHIIPDTLIKTELGRDLLAEDYILKQVSSSLIYPDSAFGKTFWSKVYEEAYRKFGVTEVPVNVFNKIWILPQKATVFERGNMVYIVHAHLKVMLEEDYLAQQVLGNKINKDISSASVKDISKQVLREVVVPAIEKEVNEDKNFAQVRQVFYALILAQWYQDVFKKSIINKFYSGRNKVAGIDVSDPQNKELIYHRYLAAYKKGVFNYIKEETDRLTQQPVPRKYFSGGFVDRHVDLAMASDADFAEASASLQEGVDLNVNLKPVVDPAMVSPAKWFDLNTPKDILAQLKGLPRQEDGTFKRQDLYEFIDAYAAYVATLRFYPVQGAWPVLKAITLLSKEEEKDLVAALAVKYPNLRQRPELVEKIFLMNKILDRVKWLKDRTPHLVGRTIYMLAAEIHHWAGGLGPVMKFHGKGMRDLGADVKYIEARYQYSINGTVERSRFSEIGRRLGEEPKIAKILELLIEKGLVHEFSPTELKPNTQRTVTKYQVEKIGLNWNYVVKTLTDREAPWAVQISPSEVSLRANLQAERNRISGAFGDKNFSIIYPLLKQAQNVLTEASLQEIAGDYSGDVWKILQHPLDYTDRNIGMKTLKEAVDHFIVEMGDINRKGIVVKQAFSDDPFKQDQIWDELTAKGYVNSMGEIQFEFLRQPNKESFIISLPETWDEKTKEGVYNILQRVSKEEIRQVWVEVALGTDENDIPTYLFRDVEADGVSSYYTKMLYNYKGRENPVGKEESMAFINVASAQLLKRLETRRKEEQKQGWKPAVVHANDGQFAPLQAVTMSRYGSDDVIKNIFWAFTTHTYRNRGGNNDVYWTVNTFLKHMMGIKDRFINAFRRNDNYIDYTSGGVRLANWAGAVSDKHRNDVSGLDPNSDLVSVTNGAAPEEMAAKFRGEFNKLKAAGIISATADFERPTAQEVGLAKIESKKRLNEAKIITANGDFVVVDLDKPLIGDDRRLVEEKAGRQRAFTDDAIWMLVKLGYNVVLMGNHQGTEESERLAAGLRELEKKINAEKNSSRWEQYPGRFQFVQSFTAEQKKLFLAACDVQVQDSDNHTGANEAFEEDIAANAGYEAGPTYREGAITDQGIPVDIEHPGEGNILIPQEDTEKSWIDTVYKPLMQLWKKDPGHVDFYKNAALSPRLNRSQNYLITSAAYLMEYEKVLARQEQEALEDEGAQAKIIDTLKGRQDRIAEILYHNRNGVTSFKFEIMGQPRVYDAYGEGLKAFIDEEKKLEDEFGYDALLRYYKEGDFRNYLTRLFDQPASDLLNNWIEKLKYESGPSLVEKAARLRQFVEGLTTGLEKQLQKKTGADSAMAVPGGIKLANIKVERQGNLMTDVISDKALEDMLANAQGLSGVIVGITPIPDLMDFLQLSK